MSSRKDLKPVSEEKMSVLTKRQQEAYLLRIEGMTYARIGRELNISASAATQLIHHAERRFREYDRYMDARERNTMPVDFPITRGELLLALSGLRLLQDEVGKEYNRITSQDWRARLPYKYTRIEELKERIQRAIYGETAQESQEGHGEKQAEATKGELHNNENGDGGTE